MTYNKMPPVICLCGSTKFKDTFLEVAKKFTLNNTIVVMPGVFGHFGDIITEEQKQQLDTLHKYKIVMSDIVFVVDVDKYVGKSTSEEIGFAKALNKPIYYYSDMMEKKEEKENENVSSWSDFYLRRFTEEY